MRRAVLLLLASLAFVSLTSPADGAPLVCDTMKSKDLWLASCNIFASHYWSAFVLCVCIMVYYTRNSKQNPES